MAPPVLGACPKHPKHPSVPTQGYTPYAPFYHMVPSASPGRYLALQRTASCCREVSRHHEQPQAAAGGLMLPHAATECLTLPRAASRRHRGLHRHPRGAHLDRVCRPRPSRGAGQLGEPVLPALPLHHAAVPHLDHLQAEPGMAGPGVREAGRGGGTSPACRRRPRTQGQLGSSRTCAGPSHYRRFSLGPTHPP